MRRLFIAAVTTASLMLVPAAAPASNSPVAHAACMSATVAGAHKCIARGQFCAHNARAMKDYRKYGFTCSKRDARGNWHLQ